MEQLTKAIEFIKENKVYGVDISLHLHFDRDEEYDYTGLHSVNVNVMVKRFDKYIGKERSVIQSHEIDLEGLSIEDCRKKHIEVYEMVRSVYESAISREFIHGEPNER